MILKILIINLLLCADIFSGTGETLSDFSQEALNVAKQTFNALRGDAEESFGNFGLCKKTCENLASEVRVPEPMVGDFSLAQHYGTSLDPAVQEVAHTFIENMLLNSDVSEAMKAVSLDSERILRQLATGYDDLCDAVTLLNKRCHDQREAVDFLADTVKGALKGVLQGVFQSSNISSALRLLRGESSLKGFVRSFPGGQECERGVYGLEGLRVQQDVWLGELRYLVLKLLEAGAEAVFPVETKEVAAKTAKGTLAEAWYRTQDACEEGGTPSLVFHSTLSLYLPDADYETAVLPSVENAGPAFMKAMQGVPCVKRCIHSIFRTPIDAASILKNLASRERLMQGVLMLEKKSLQTELSTHGLASMTHNILSRSQGPSVNRALAVIQKEPALRGMQMFINSANSVRGRRIISGLVRYASLLRL